MPRARWSTWIAAATIVSGFATHVAAQDAAREWRIPILVYHHVQTHGVDDTRVQRALSVPPDVFAEQMDAIRSAGIRVIGLHRLLDLLDGRDTLNGPAVVITFDDGWRSQFEHALPVLTRLGFPATFFIITSAPARHDGYMSWDDLRALRDAGMTIGSHTVTHPDLTHLRDTALLRRELTESREALEREMDRPVDFFAYPYAEWSEREVNAVRGAGYLAARGVDARRSNRSGDRFALHAVQVSEDMETFRRIIEGARAPD